MVWMAGVQFLGGARNFLFSTASRLALGPNQPPIQWVQGALYLGAKWPVHAPNHSYPSNAEVKTERSRPSLQHTLSWYGA